MVAKTDYITEISLCQRTPPVFVLPVASRSIVRKRDEADDDRTHRAAEHGNPETHMVVLEEVDRHRGIQARRFLRHDDVRCSALQNGDYVISGCESVSG